MPCVCNLLCYRFTYALNCLIGWRFFFFFQFAVLSFHLCVKLLDWLAFFGNLFSNTKDFLWNAGLQIMAPVMKTLTLG